MTVFCKRSGNTKRGRDRDKKDIGIVRGERGQQRQGERGVLSEDVLSMVSSDQPIRGQARPIHIHTDCVRLTNLNFWLDGSRASFLVPGYSPSKSC